MQDLSKREELLGNSSVNVTIYSNNIYIAYEEIFKLQVKQ